MTTATLCVAAAAPGDPSWPVQPRNPTCEHSYAHIVSISLQVTVRGSQTRCGSVWPERANPATRHQMLTRPRQAKRALVRTLVTQKSERRKVARTMKRVKSSRCLCSSWNSSMSPVITDSIPPICSQQSRGAAGRGAIYVNSNGPTPGAWTRVGAAQRLGCRVVCMQDSPRPLERPRRGHCPLRDVLGHSAAPCG